MTDAARRPVPMATLASLLLLAVLLPAPALSATAPDAVASPARRPLAAPRVTDARSLPSLDAAGGPALPYSPIVSLSDTFLIAGFGFQDPDGACQPRGWVGEDRASRIFAHPDSRFVANQAFFTGRPGSDAIENLTRLKTTTAVRAPRALALEASGRVVFSDEGFGKQRLFRADADPASPRVFRYGSFPPGATTPSPHSAIWNPFTRTVIASDEANGRLVEFAPLGSLGNPTDFPTGTDPRQVAIGDMNNDDAPDLVVTINNVPGTVSVIFGDGAGGFYPPRDFDAGDGPIAVRLADLNGDHNLDIVAGDYAANTVAVLISDGDGGFLPRTLFPTGVNPRSLALGYLNDDLALDLAVANQGSGTVSVMFGNGDGGFGPKTDIPTGSGPHAVAIGDLNADGDQDLVVANYGDNTLAVVLGDGNGGFAVQAPIPAGGAPTSVVIGDLNGDGAPDLAVANWSSSTVSSLLGDGAGGFVARTEFAVGPNPNLVAIGDLDGDGALDLATANYGSNFASVLPGDGYGGFGTRTDLGTGVNPSSIAIEDLNHDDRPDVVVVNRTSNSVSVLLGKGGATVIAGLGGSPADGPIPTASIGNPAQVALDSTGIVYFADPTTSRVRKLDDGYVLTLPNLGTGPGLDRPTGVAIDWAHRILFISDTNNSRVLAYDLDPSHGTFQQILYAVTVGQPGSLALDPGAGVLYIASFFSILKMDLGSHALAYVAGGGGFGPPSGSTLGTQSNLAAPGGLTWDGAGGLYFTDALENLVYHLRANGELEVVAGIPVAMAMGATALRFGTDYATDPDEVGSWVAPSGYGNNWSQRLFSSSFSYALHPGAVLEFDAFLDLGQSANITTPYGAEFMAVQAQLPDHSWAFVNLRLSGAGAPSFPVRTFVARGFVHVRAALGEDGNDLLGLDGTTRFRIVVQTDEQGSSEDGYVGYPFGPAIVDNVQVGDSGGPILPLSDFENGTLGPWTLAALNGVGFDWGCFAPGSSAGPAVDGPVNPCQPYVRDVPEPHTFVDLRAGFDPQDPTCAWTFLSSGDSLASGTFARLTSPWIQMVPGDSLAPTRMLISFSGKLNTEDQRRFVRVLVRGRDGGATFPRFVSSCSFLLDSGTQGGDATSPYINQRVLTYPEDFVGAGNADLLQVVFQVEDRGESTFPGNSLDDRPRTALPYLDDIRLYQLGVDRDHDGVADAFDPCPTVCAAGQDGDGDGCPDPTATLRHVESWSRFDVPIRYTIAQGADPKNPSAGDAAEIQAGFDAWTAAPGCTLTVVRAPDSPLTAASPFDGVNLVTFQDPDFPFEPGVLAVTPTFSFTRRAVYNDRVVLPGQIVDSDMIFNPASHFHTPGFTPSGVTSYDLRSVTTHEAGHLFGLSHSGVLHSTMFFVLQDGAGAASLEADDGAALGAAYPGPGFRDNFGAILGRVTRGVSGDSIPGALVTAVRLDGGGAPTDSVASDYTDEHGAYALRGLAPGSYGVRLTPLDGEVGGYPLTPEFISLRVADGAQTNFLPEWFGGPESASDDPAAIAPVGVGAGVATAGIDIRSNIDTTPPFVIASLPAVNAIDVRPDATLLIKFSERINPATLDGAFRLHVQSKPGTSLGGQALLINNGRTVIFNPTDALHLDETYVLEVTSAVHDREGVPLSPVFSATFRTLASLPLAISDIEPRAAARGSFITVLGGGFDPAGEDSVRFSACGSCAPEAVPATHVTPTSMVVRVPAGAVSGPVRAVVHQGTSNPSASLRVLDAAPQIAPSRVTDIALDFAPTDVALSPDGAFAFAVGAGGLAAINLATGTRTYKPIGAASHIAITPDGRRALVTQPALGRVLDVDADHTSLTLGDTKATIPVGLPGTPDGVTISPSGRRGYVTDQTAGLIYVIDTDVSSATRDSVVGELADSVAVLTGGVAVLATGDQVLYTSGNVGSRAHTVGGPNAALAHPGASAGGVAVTPSAGEGLFTGTGAFGGELLSVLLSNGDPGATAQIDLGGNLRDVVVAPQGQSALVVNSGNNKLQVVGVGPNDVASYHESVAEAGTGQTPVAVSQSEDGGVIAVANFGSRTIGIYRTGGSAGLVRAIPPVARPGDQVALQATGGPFGAGAQVDLGSGPFAIGYRTPDNAGAAFAVPAGPQREAALSAIDPAGTRTLALGIRVVEPIPTLAPHAGGFALPLAPLSCPGRPLGNFDAMLGSPDGRLLALVRNPGLCAGQLELFAADDEDPSGFGQRLTRADVVPAGLSTRDMAFTTDGRALWALGDGPTLRVMNSDRTSLGFGGQLGVINLASGVVSGPGGITADPLGRFMCVGNAVNDTVLFFAPTFTPGMIPLSRLPVQGPSDALAASPDGRVLVAAGGGRARFVNLETRTLIGTSAIHGLTGGGLQRAAVGIPTRGRRAVVRFTNGIGLYNLDPAAGAVGAELYFGDPFLAAGVVPGRLLPGPGGDDVIATCANRDSLVRIDTSVIPPAIAYGALDGRARAIAGTPDGRRLWLGDSDGIGVGGVTLSSLSAASDLALVAGGGQSGLAGATLPQAVIVHAADGTGNPETGVVLKFTLTSGNGSLDHDSTTVFHLTDANGEAQVTWTLPASLGIEDLAITALGVGDSIGVSAEVVADNSQISPAVLAFGPPDGSSDFNTGTPVFIRFNQAMDPVTTTPRMKLFANGGPVTGEHRYEQDGTFVLFQPAQPLAFAARCSLVIEPGALDTDGQLFAAGGYSVFHVGDAPSGPTVTALDPPAAAVGSPVVLEGTGFGSLPSQNTVLFNQVPTTVTFASPTSITAPVPPGATSGAVTVQVGSARSPDVNFTVLEPAAPITTLTDSLPAGPTATRVVITPDGKRCYVTNPGSNSVTAIDLDAAVTLAVITVGRRPSGIALLPDGSRAYVCNQNSDDVSVIDIQPGSPDYHRVINTIPVGHQPRDIAVSPFGPEVVVVEYGSATVSVIDANPGNATFDEVTTTTNTGVGGTGVGITPDGGRAYICTSGGTLVRFDLRSGAVTTTTNTGVGGTAIGITPDGTLAVVLLENGTLLGINIVPGSSRENAVTTTTNTGVGGGGGGISISPDGGAAYVSNTDGNVVFVFRIVYGSGQPVSLVPGPAVQFVKEDSVRVGQSPLGIAIDPSHGRFGLVANSGSGTVSVLGVLGSGPPPLEIMFKFTPNSLNLKSMGNWVTGVLEPPPGYDAHEIDVASLRLNGVVAVDPDAPASVGANGPTSENQLRVRFPRNQVELVVAEGDAVPVTVTGRLGTRRITGTDLIKVKRGKVTAPVAGDLLRPGQTCTVRWTTPGGVNATWVAVLHSFDRGLHWTLDATRLANTGSYAWSVPMTIADSAKVAVALVESGDTTGVNVSAVLGVSDYFKIWGTTDVEAAPAELSLAPARPNPAGGRAILRFGLPRAADVRLEIYDLQGRRVRTLLRGPAAAGWHEVAWTGRVDGGVAGAGMYFVRFQAEGRGFEQRLVWLR